MALPPGRIDVRPPQGFVRGAAMEMPRGLRINVVSPTLVAESAPIYGGSYFPGVLTMPANEVALGYVKSVKAHRAVGSTGWAGRETGSLEAVRS